jgi:hypothetical protein
MSKISVDKKFKSGDQVTGINIIFSIWSSGVRDNETQPEYGVRELWWEAAQKYN